jgi:hypothetical protein
MKTRFSDSSSDESQSSVSTNSTDVVIHQIQNDSVAFGSDGSSTMVGKDSGVAKRLKEEFPNLIFWHCLNYRIELAMSDALDSIGGESNHFDFFCNKLSSLFTTSVKNKREITQISKEQIIKIGKIFDVRWVASSFRTVLAIWHNWKSLYLFLERGTIDQSKKEQLLPVY